MGSMGLVVALLATGYFAGVWTAFLVLRQPQREYEGEASGAIADRRSEQLSIRATRLEVDT
jgi:hypothetical protein